MLELGPENVIEYLVSTGRLPPGTSSTAEACAWGVSNAVLRINNNDGRPDFVIKQSREKLRTRADWFSRLDRIWREMEILKTLAPLLPAGVVPKVLFYDRENYLFAMEAIDPDHKVWKAALLEGDIDLSIAETLGGYLATVHRETANDDQLCQQFGGRVIFDELRVDPFYRRIAQVHPEIKSEIEHMIDEMFHTAVCLVHADFSPKNILVTNKGISLVDFETGHFGDPAFDLGFFLSHLLLKAVLHAERFVEFQQLVERFWHRYCDGLGELRLAGPFGKADLESRTLGHLAGCMLSRIDGKSTIDYLPKDDTRDLVRAFCRELFLEPLHDFKAALDRLASLLDGKGSGVGR